MGFLSGKAALVTGSTSGIGLGIARALASEGASIVLNGFGDAAAIAALRREIEETHGVAVRHVAADMRKPDEITAMVRSAEAEFGAIDVLVNNAGIQHVAPIDEFPPEKWNDIIAINLSSAFHTIRAALPKMKAKGWGSIVNTAWAHAFVASPYKVAYVAAKHGIAGITKTVALEVAQQHITVNAIAPGYVDTEMVRAVPAEVLRKIVAKVPIGRLGHASDIARGVAFLTADDADFITGSTLSINGGQHMY